MVMIELLEAAKDIFSYQIAVLQPAFFAFFIAYALPALAMLKDDNLIAVLDHSRFGIHGSYAIAQRSLGGSRDVKDFILLAGAMAAS